MSYTVGVVDHIWKEMGIRTIKIQSAGIPLRQRPCTRWTFVALITFNFLSLSLFLKYNSHKLIAHVVQDDTAIATYTIFRNSSFLASIEYLFIVRSDNKNLKLRNTIRKSWCNNDTVEDIHHRWGSSIDAKLLFIIENSPNTMKYAVEDLQFNDTLWIPNSRPRSIESVRFLEVLPTAHYYIIGLDTTFINFDNVVHFLEEQGKII